MLQQLGYLLVVGEQKVVERSMMLSHPNHKRISC